MKALQLFAGPRARARLAERGLRPEDVRIVPGAAGGPKGLILNGLDRQIFGPWLGASTHEVHLLGASIGAWRMATACLNDPEREFARLADEYVHQRYEHRPGKAPTAADVTRGFSAKLAEVFGGREAQLLAHPRYRLHVFTSRGRHLLAREGRLRTPLGYGGAFATNLLARRAMGAWLERVVFSDPRAPLPMPLNDYRSRQVELNERNFLPAVLASCSIPFWLQAVHDIPGAPAGAYWDGGITDYHLHLDYASMIGDGLVLYPHFQRQVIPGWLDKALKGRHGSTAFLDNVVLLAPNPDWVRTLPRGKLPDREDFKHYGEDTQARAAAWQRAIAESERLRDEFATACERSSIAAEPL
ncbi:patatin-like phospholipase family protein [Roseateles violae]|uniref:Phospholipase n=1 Tax=Roseateles violae TaxID=3058042 RepID=A0ABT8DZC0_9BURK|nr:patatin-like phospholipase family protein [Pelomonas sp. PFR6]MDN3922903.1 phospholipase [Pelomonas sp. PFR6]